MDEVEGASWEVKEMVEFKVSGPAVKRMEGGERARREVKISKRIEKGAKTTGWLSQQQIYYLAHWNHRNAKATQFITDWQKTRFHEKVGNPQADWTPERDNAKLFCQS